VAAKPSNAFQRGDIALLTATPFVLVHITLHTTVTTVTTANTAVPDHSSYHICLFLVLSLALFSVLLAIVCDKMLEIVAASPDGA
jgi:DMSO reductase anchor subunit